MFGQGFHVEIDAGLDHVVGHDVAGVDLDVDIAVVGKVLQVATFLAALINHPHTGDPVVGIGGQVFKPHGWVAQINGVDTIDRIVDGELYTGTDCRIDAVGGFQQDREIGIVRHPLGCGDTGLVPGDAVFDGKRCLGGAARMGAGPVLLEIGVAVAVRIAGAVIEQWVQTVCCFPVIGHTVAVVVVYRYAGRRHRVTGQIGDTADGERKNFISRDRRHGEPVSRAAQVGNIIIFRIDRNKIHRRAEAVIIFSGGTLHIRFVVGDGNRIGGKIDHRKLYDRWRIRIGSGEHDFR